MINPRVKARAEKRAADDRERYERLLATPTMMRATAFVAGAERSHWYNAVRNQIGIGHDAPVPLPRLCAEMQTRAEVSISIKGLDLRQRVRLFAAIASILTPPTK